MIRKALANLIAGAMYAALLCGSLAVVICTIYYLPPVLQESWSRGSVDFLVMVTLLLLLGALLTALGWVWTSLTDLTRGGILNKWTD